MPPLGGSVHSRVSEALGHVTQCFKAWSPRLNAAVLLRRLILPSDDAGLSNDAFFVAKTLCDLEHPAIVRFRDLFPTTEFGDNCE